MLCDVKCYFMTINVPKLQTNFHSIRPSQSQRLLHAFAKCFNKYNGNNNTIITIQAWPVNIPSRQAIIKTMYQNDNALHFHKFIAHVLGTTDSEIFTNCDRCTIIGYNI